MIKPRVFAAGAAHLDRRGRVAGDYVPGASNPGTMREEVGGGVFNALRNAVRHGVEGALFSLRGGDIAGETVARAVAQWGIDDRSAVFLDRTTPSYTALLDRHGELIAGFADMELYETGFARQLRRRAIREAIAASDAVLCDANMPSDALAGLAMLAAGKPVFAVAVSPAKVVRLSGVLEHLSCLFMNMREARVLAGLGADATPLQAARALRAMGLARAVITAGASDLTGYDEDGPFRIAPAPAGTVVDVTGAGDALAGTTVAHVMKGVAFREAVRHGVAASRLTVESASVVTEPDDETFAAALALAGTALPVA